MRKRAAALASLVIVGLTTIAAQQTAVPSPTGAISGVVLDAGTNKPLAGAVVSLSALIAGQTGLNMQITDSSGRFVFTRLPVADFTINATKLGYFDGGYGRTLQRTAVRRITLVEGQWFQNADVKLWRQGAMSGTVLDETGEPVVDIWVRALAQIGVAGESRWVPGPLTKTDDRGMYRFAALTPGKWTVMAPSVQSAVPADTSIYTLSGTTQENAAASESRGRPFVPRSDPAVPIGDRLRLILGGSATPPPAVNGRPRVYPLTFYPSARSVADAAVVEMTGADRDTVDIALHPASAFSISGALQGPPDAIAGFVVRLMPAGSESMGFEVATSLGTSDGTFVFPVVPAGSYTILADRSSSGYSYNPATLIANAHQLDPPGLVFRGMSSSAVPATMPGTMFENRTQAGDLSLAGRVHVDVSDRDVDGLAVPLIRGASLSGHVVIESNPARPSSSGLLFLDVYAEPANGDPALGQPRSMLSRDDPSMSFKIEGLRNGEYLLRALSGGQAVKSVMYAGKDYTYTPFDASSGRDIEGVIVTVTTQSVTLSGTVRDAQGKPVAGNVAVICFPAERNQWSRYGIQPPRLRSVMVASGGGYQMPSLPAGDYFVIAVDDELAGDWKDPKFLEKAALVAEKVTLNWGEPKTQELKLVQVR